MKNILLAACSFLLTVVAIAQAPSPNFSANVTEGCSPLVVEFTDLSSGNPTSWYWDFGNGATSTLQNPSTSYFNPGTYTVTLKATNAAGSNTITKTSFITIYSQPVVAFSAPSLTGCTPVQIQFADQSSTAPGTIITGWSWNFGDGGSSTDQNPSHYYRTPGNYTVTLTIETNKGCTKSLTKPYYVTATEGVKPSFTHTDPAVCSAPATVSFTNTSTGPGNLTYSWNLGNGNTSTAQNTSTTYNTNGNYKVTLFVTSDMGCSDSTSATVVVGKANTDFIVPANICPGVPVQFTNNSTPRPISANWQFSNGTSDTLKNGITTFNTPGTYTVTLINTYSACTDTLVKTITTSPVPTVQFSVSDTGRCQPPLTVNFTNTSNGTTYMWDFGDSTTSTQTNPSHTYTKEGDFTVTLIATGANGCSDTLRKVALVQIGKPKISFPTLPAKGCIQLTVNFAASIQAVDEVTSYSWNFGNGNTSTSQTPTHTYTAEGVYTVSLTITTRTGCTETFSMAEAVKAGTKPTADFTSNVTTACANPGIQFTNLSTNASEFLWEFSDGSTSTLKDPNQTFVDTGWIHVKMTAINKGCETTIVKNNYAYIKPSVSKFSYVPSCSNPLQYTFTDESIGALTWSWNFGDGTTFTGQNPPPHTYSSAGTYVVTLQTTNNGCTYTASRTIVIRDLTPDFTAGPTEGCNSVFPVFFASSPDPGAMVSYTWNYGDGVTETSSGVVASHFYNKSGSYTVTLTTVDSFGCVFTRNKPNLIKVNGPDPNFTSITNRGCMGLTTTFVDSTVNNGASVVKWTWDFGDGNIQTFTAPPFQHTYDSVGDYDVKLIVEDATGCKDSILKREFVKISTVTALFNTNGATCPNANFPFFNQSTSDLPLTYTWSFGDGGTSTVEAPQHTYTDTGFYDVWLVATDLAGCSDSFTKRVQVSLPKASFTANNLISFCTPFEAKFTSTSYFAEKYFWDLGNTTSTAQDPMNYYTSTGVYDIKLTIESPGGCRDSVSQQLEIYNPNDGTITYDPNPGCRPRTVTFSAFRPMNARFIWDFGDGNVIDTNTNTMTHVYENFGKFIPRVILKQPEGCIVPITGTDTIEIYGALAKFAIDNYNFCDSGTINIIDSTTSQGAILGYTWDFGDGTTSNQPSPSHLYTTPGNYTINLYVQTQGGCVDTAQLENPVMVIQSPDISVTGDTVICANERLQLNGVFNKPDSSQVSWSWQFPNGQSSTAQSPPARQYGPGNYTVITTAVNSSGCKDSVTTNIIVHSVPVITLPDTIVKNVGVPVTIPGQYSPGVTSYLWTPSTSLSCTDCPQPVASTKFSTNYTVKVNDTNGCTDSATIRVIVLCEGATIFFPNAFSPNGDGNNDVFYPRGSGLDRVKSVRVFNRWGEVVYEQKDFPVNNSAFGWNGRYKGKAPQPGVYIYQADIFCENGEVIRIAGNVALIQ